MKEVTGRFLMSAHFRVTLSGEGGGKASSITSQIGLGGGVGGVGGLWGGVLEPSCAEAKL